MEGASTSGVAWPAIIGGAFAAASLSLILLALGSGFSSCNESVEQKVLSLKRFFPSVRAPARVLAGCLAAPLTYPPSVGNLGKALLHSLKRDLGQIFNGQGFIAGSFALSSSSNLS